MRVRMSEQTDMNTMLPPTEMPGACAARERHALDEARKKHMRNDGARQS